MGVMTNLYPRERECRPLYLETQCREKGLWLTLDRYAFQLAGRGAEIPHTVMLGRAVIPKGDRAWTPFESNLILRQHELSEEMRKQALTLLFVESGYMRGKDGVYK